MKNAFNISDLIAKDIKGSITSKELIELNAWRKKSVENETVYQNYIDTKKQLSKLKEFNSVNASKAWSNIEDELFLSKTISLFPNRFLKYAAAILIPLMLVGGGYLYFSTPTAIESQLYTLDKTIKPGVQKATLVLSDGGTHDLIGANSEKVMNDAGIEIVNEGNALSYVSSTTTADGFTPATYNQLITPVGGGYNLKLADGTNVWLNSDSEIKFPVEFSDSTRHVFLKGEAYFQVAHNGLPFIVSSGDMDIRVMGTSFNVSAYANDLEYKTTLTEGQVRVDYLDVKKNKTHKFLTPNKQATINLNETGIALSEVDASQYSSWIDGKFEFSKEPLPQVLKRLSRWYGFEFEFENKAAMEFHFSGRLDKQEKISTLLEMLELTTKVKFSVKENKIVVQ